LGENVNSHPVTCVRIPVTYNKTANINVKTAVYSSVNGIMYWLTHRKQQKWLKRWYYSASHWRLGDVMLDKLQFFYINNNNNNNNNNNMTFVMR